MGYKSTLELEPTILSSIKEHVVNILKYSDCAQNLKVKDIYRNNYDSQKVQMWRIETKLMTNKDWKRRGFWLRMKNIRILTKYKPRRH